MLYCSEIMVLVLLEEVYFVQNGTIFAIALLIQEIYGQFQHSHPSRFILATLCKPIINQFIISISFNTLPFHTSIFPFSVNSFLS